jgi:hypothetical protein
MERRQAEQIRDLERGRFLGLGPAIARRPVAVKIGAVKTGTRGGTHKLMPPPVTTGEDFQELLFARHEEEALPPPPQRAEPPPRAAEEIMRALADTPSARPAAPELDFGENEPVVIAVLEDIVADLGDAAPSVSALYQDFGVRCRMKGLKRSPLDLPAFRRRFAMAQAGMADADDPRWQDAMRAAEPVPEDMLAPFLLIARAALDGQPCPDDSLLARAYGTSSPGRVRRLIDYMEKLGVIVARTDFSGKRSIGVPGLGLSTAAADG